MTVSIMYLRALLEAVERTGVTRDVFFAGIGFETQRLDNVSARLTLLEWNMLQERALMLTEDEALGLRMGEMANAAAFSLMAPLVEHATTLRDGIAALSKFQRLLSDRPAWVFREDDTTAKLLYEPQPAPPRVHRLGAELTATTFFRLIRHFRRDASPYEVAFAYPAPPHASEYARIFEGFERFDRRFTGVVFDRKLLGASQQNPDPDLHSALHAHAERRAARIDAATPYAQRVHDHLVAQANLDSSDMENVARGLGLSARSLRRRLSEENASFRKIADDARAEVAKNLIAGDCSIQEAAYKLGFSDPSAFHHAFKKWTGMTPREYRLRRGSA